jgi:2-keto-4-pentenoate hydratase/2-oxohepta-3-ene-1,7-dioic acid hydratase in catechol pathway
LIFGVAHLVSFLSRSTTLLPGAVIATGTPGGVGFTREPPEFLRPGDMVEVTIEGIGTLAHQVVGDLALTASTR